MMQHSVRRHGGRRRGVAEVVNLANFFRGAGFSESPVAQVVVLPATLKKFATQS